ncbi:Uncharacterised protein [Bacteroides xylanisolvens]|nr:Uncharacterised protein [Bacteroides xylanisolvens]
MPLDMDLLLLPVVMSLIGIELQLIAILKEIRFDAFHVGRVLIPAHADMLRLDAPDRLSILVFLHFDIGKLHGRPVGLGASLFMMVILEEKIDAKRCQKDDEYDEDALFISAHDLPPLVSFQSSLMPGAKCLFSSSVSSIYILMRPGRVQKRCWNQSQSVGCSLMKSSMIVAIFCAFVMRSFFVSPVSS